MLVMNVIAEILKRETTEEGHSVLRVRVMSGKEPRLLNRFPNAQTI